MWGMRKVNVGSFIFMSQGSNLTVMSRLALKLPFLYPELKRGWKMQIKIVFGFQLKELKYMFEPIHDALWNMSHTENERELRNGETWDRMKIPKGDEKSVLREKRKKSRESNEDIATLLFSPIFFCFGFFLSLKLSLILTTTTQNTTKAENYSFIELSLFLFLFLCPPLFLFQFSLSFFLFSISVSDHEEERERERQRVCVFVLNKS